MSKNNENKYTTFLRTQSYIVNGEPNPLSTISRKKYFAKYVNFGNGKIKKIDIKKHKHYINEIKSHKNKKSYSSEKFTKKKILKNNNNKIEQEKENNEIFNKKNNYKPPKYPNNNIESKQIKENNDNIINGFVDYFINEKENMYINNNEKNDEIISNEISNKIFVNNIPNKKNSIQYDISNEIQKNYDIINNIDNEYNFTTGNQKNNSNILNLMNKNNCKNIFSKTTKLNFHPKHNSFSDNIDNIYKTYSQKKKKSKKIIGSVQKDKSFINKILLNNEEDDYININNYKRSNKLLNKLNYYTKIQNNQKSYVNKKNNITKEILNSMKKSINKKTLINPCLNSHKNNCKKINSKINKIPNNESINIYNSINGSIKNYKKFNNIHNCVFMRNNNFSPKSIECNYMTYQQNKYKPKLNKNLTGKSISNIIYAIRDERKTNQFIKELNRNNKLNNSFKNIRFSFSNEKNDLLTDEFFSSINFFNGNNFFSVNEENYPRKNSYSKNNISVGAYIQRNSNIENSYKSYFNLINKELINNVISKLENKTILPPNHAI